MSGHQDPPTSHPDDGAPPGPALLPDTPTCILLDKVKLNDDPRGPLSEPPVQSRAGAPDPAMTPPSTNPTLQKPLLLWRRPRPWDSVSPALLDPRHQESCTLRTSQLQERGFWHKYLNMKPSFAKQIRVFSRIILTCSITSENVLICNMSPAWLL